LICRWKILRKQLKFSKMQNSIQLIEIVANQVYPLREYKFFTLKNVGNSVSVNGLVMAQGETIDFPQDIRGIPYDEDLNIVFGKKTGNKLQIIGRI
jgi:hypothetical protein